MPPDISHKKYPPELEQALDRFIESAGKISANMLGMVNKVGGQIYALLFLSREPLSLDDISKTLQTSKGNISVNIRLLEECKLVKKSWIKGSRRDFYEANRDYPRKFLKGFFDKLREGIEESIRLVSRCQSQFREALAGIDVESDESKDALFMIQQLELLNMFYLAASQVFEDFYQGRELNTELLRQVVLD